MGRRGPAPRFTHELRVNVRPEHRSAVLALAEASHVSVSSVVRSALDGFLRITPDQEDQRWDNEPSR